MECGEALPYETAQLLQLAIQSAAGVHEADRHRCAPCWDGRVEVLAFAAHVLGLRPTDMGKVHRQMKEHLKDCTHPPRDVPPEDW